MRRRRCRSCYRFMGETAMYRARCLYGLPNGPHVNPRAIACEFWKSARKERANAKP